MRLVIALLLPPNPQYWGLLALPWQADVGLLYKSAEADLRIVRRRFQYIDPSLSYSAHRSHSLLSKNPALPNNLLWLMLRSTGF